VNDVRGEKSNGRCSACVCLDASECEDI